MPPNVPPKHFVDNVNIHDRVKTESGNTTTNQGENQMGQSILDMIELEEMEDVNEDCDQCGCSHPHCCCDADRD